jgi:hypothetical protein
MNHEALWAAGSDLGGHQSDLPNFACGLLYPWTMIRFIPYLCPSSQPLGRRQERAFEGPLQKVKILAQHMGFATKPTQLGMSNDLRRSESLESHFDCPNGQNAEAKVKAIM